MFNNFTKMLFFLILVAGSLITASSTSWFGAWMGLEINLLAFIPLMGANKLISSSEASLKYFLTQSLASGVLLLSILLFLMEESFVEKEFPYSLLMILSSLLMKSGSAPFHFWFPSVMEGLSWKNGLVLMTWQKIAPVILISHFSISWFLIFSLVFSSAVGSFGGLNQTSLRKLMAFSSINHLGWMLAAVMMSESLWFVYFLFYSFLSVLMISFFYSFNLFHLNQLFSLTHFSPELKILFLLNMLSLGGLPPFLGFFPKWQVIQMLVMNNQIFVVVVLVSMALVTLFFYLRLGFSSFMMSYFEPSWKISSGKNNLLEVSFVLSFFSLAGFLLISLLYFVL